MKFIVLPELAPHYRQRWQKQFVGVGRDYLESIWRRSEDAERTGNPNDRRRRIIHVIDKYDMVPHGNGRFDFAITECYMWLCSTLPKAELRRYVARIEGALDEGRWQRHEGNSWTLYDLTFSYTVFDRHPEDEKAGRDYVGDYQTIECTLLSKGFPRKRITKESPWAVFNTGVRRMGTRTPHPHVITDLHEIMRYLPAQIELGGGASLELGLPPLNYFHTAYNLYAPNGRFAYGDTDNLLAMLLPDPEKFYTTQAALPYAQALTAKPNYFYRYMSKLHHQGWIVGPVITNNFDGLCALVNLDELYVRRYEEANIVPNIAFPARARSLLVIGSHADRRRVQEAAKAHGLQVIYVDPETYVNHDGRTIAYPLEKIEADDMLLPMPAGEFARALHRVLASKRPSGSRSRPAATARTHHSGAKRQ